MSGNRGLKLQGGVEPRVVPSAMLKENTAVLAQMFLKLAALHRSLLAGRRCISDVRTVFRNPHPEAVAVP
jgi:hypothetical protein